MSAANCVDMITSAPRSHDSMRAHTTCVPPGLILTTPYLWLRLKVCWKLEVVAEQHVCLEPLLRQACDTAERHVLSAGTAVYISTQTWVKKVAATRVADGSHRPCCLSKVRGYAGLLFALLHHIIPAGQPGRLCTSKAVEVSATCLRCQIGLCNVISMSLI